jgi:signal transduction histidine kinase
MTAQSSAVLRPASDQMRQHRPAEPGHLVADRDERATLGRTGRQLGVRGRLVLTAVVVVFVALLAGGSALIYILQEDLKSSATAGASTRAGQVRDLIRLAGVSKAAASLPDEARSGQYVQIIEGTKVIAASSRMVRSRPLSTRFPRPGQSVVSELDIDNLGAAGDWMVVSTGVDTAGRSYVVQVATPINVQRETVRMVAIFLLAATPLLLAGVALAVWLLVGRALSSVERIRRQVAAVDASRLELRVAVPPTQDEIAALANTMNTMLARLEASHQAQRGFVSDASHELRSPLATLMTATELAVSADEPTRTRLLATIVGELARLRDLVADLMTLARADASDLIDVCEDVDMDDLVDEEARRVRTTGRVDVEVSLQPVRILGDIQRLRQALRNLVDNAERHAHSTVRVVLDSGDNEMRLRVENDGPVVPLQEREHVFERFVRLDDSRSRDEGGSGLGLAIARTTVQSHGGSLDIIDSADGWCCFQIRIPLADDREAVPPSSGSGLPETARR